MFTKVEEIKTIVDKTRSYFEKGATKKITWRRKQLLGLSHFLKTEESKIKDCLRKDLKQTEILVQAGEIAIIQNSVNLALKKLDDWCYPKIVNDLPLSVFPSKAFIVREPLGVCAILGVWNFPFLTVLEPLVAAIAAGNSVVLKPSEISSHSCNLIFEKLPLYVDSQAISIITGGPEQAVELLKHRFDHIFYTGNSEIAKKVMTAAAKNLTPVTLELGGKNPVFVCDDADISLAARRIAWGKSMNMGQACVAPDYVLVNKKQTMQLCKRLGENLRKFYGKDERKWSECKDLGRIVNKRHFDRIKDMLQREKGDIVIGGTCCEEKLFIQPTVIVTDLNSPFMEKEIFGPVLVVIQTDSIDQSILIAKRFEKPLALYVFSFDVEKQKKILESVSSGGVAINDTLLQASVMSLPFGGVGHSGFGKNHGKSGFDLFSNKRSVLSNNGSFDWSIRYPPYSKKGIKLAKYCSLKSCYCTRFFNSNMVTMFFLSVLVFFILWVNR